MKILDKGIKSLKRFLFISGLVSSLALTASCGGDEGEAPEPVPPTPPAKATFSQRWNPDLNFQSRTLGRQVNYNVLVPAEYLSDPTAKFPVVYLLHGYGDSHTSWGPGHFDIQQVDANARTSGLTGPVIYVMPQGWNSYYVNRYDGGFNYMDMIVNELIPIVDRMLPTVAEAKGRAVAGYSMGGFGALALAGKNPGVFGTCISLSPSMNTDEQYRTLGSWDSQWGDIFGGSGTTGEARLTSHYKSLCPLHFFADEPASRFASLNILLDCGDDEERLYAGSGELHSILRTQGIAHEFRVRNGAHTTTYWREGLREGLALFSTAYSGGTYPEVTAVTIPTGNTPSTVEVQNAPCATALFTGAGFKGNSSSRVVYMEIGAGAGAITPERCATLMAATLQAKNVALAVVKTADAASVDADAVFSAVESTLGISITDSGRWMLASGNGLSLFAPFAWNGRKIAGFGLYDSDLAMLEDAAPAAGLYVLDITDNGTNHHAVFSTFCTLRSLGANVEYRVHNGTDNAVCADYGISNVLQLISSRIPI